MRKLFTSLSFLACFAFVQADESWLGLFMAGNKIGYAYSALTDTMLNKVPAKRSESSTVMNAGLLGQAMSITINSTSWLDLGGHPILMKFKVSSAGRVQTLDALFTQTEIHLSIDNSGAKTSKTISLPKDARVVDDAVSALLAEGNKTGKIGYYYVLDPMTATLVKNKVTLQGKGSTKVNGRTFDANVIEIAEPRAVMRAFVSAKGDLIKVEGPMGIEMLPLSKADALKESDNSANPIATDLAYSTSLKPDKHIPDIFTLKELKLKITGHELSSLPSDAHQTVTRSGASWIVDLHPDVFAAQSISIAASAQQKPLWTKPGFNIPSDSPAFKSLSKKIVAGSTTVQGASKKIHDYVQKTMVPNAGIGVLRDASEILRTREGVCRDYAVLTATLLRASNIPSRLVSGLVYEEGSFYYHAWVEVWDGKNWIGVDSTLPSGKVTAGHIKLAEGSVEEAFTFTFLDKVRVEVLDARRA